MQAALARATRWLTEPRPRLGGLDAALAVAAATLVAARWPDRARYLMSWDSDTFAIALEDYDVRGLHPHAPGYPLYVALGRLAHMAWRDANDAYIAVGFAFTMAAVALAYVLGARLADRAVAVATAAMLLAAPLVYVHQATANVYTADLACSLAVALAAWRAHQAPSRRSVALAALVFALAVGVRPSILMFLAPVAAWGVLRPPFDLRTQARRLLPAAALASGVALAWFLPMAHASGGIASWREANRLQSSQVVLGATAWRGGWDVVASNADRLTLYVRWELAWALPALVALVVLGAMAWRMQAAAPRPHASASPDRSTWTFLALWGLPATTFYLLVFSGWNEGPSGYALVVLPAYLLAAALVGRLALAQLGAASVRVALVAGGLALAAPVVGLASHAHDVRDVDYRAHDTWAEAWSHLPATFPPANASIVASYQFAHVWYHFPEYTSYDYRPPAQGPGETPDFLLIQEARGRRAVPDWYDSIAQRRTAGPHPLDPGIEALVLFDFALAGEGGPRQLKDDVPVREAFLPNGWRVLYVQVTPDRPLLEDYFTLHGFSPGEPA